MWLRRPSGTRSGDENGHVLLVALAIMMILSVLGMTALYLAGQDVPGVSAMKEETVAQQLADAAAELVVAWFHDPEATPAAVTELFSRRQGDLTTGPSFFDAAQRSQFSGTADRPDLLLDATNQTDNQILNHSSSGFAGPIRGLGQFTKLKVYGPMRPGLLGTLEVTAATAGHKPMARTVQVQLGALSIPAVRAAVQVGQGVGTLQPGGESPVRAHWGDQRIGGDLTVKRLEAIAVKLATAPVTGQPYDSIEQSLDRWTDYWIGGELSVASPPAGQGTHPIPPSNVHVHQVPTPGVRIDQWEYELTKKTALRHGTYYRLDRQGRLHSQGAADDDVGLAPSEVLVSHSRGDHRGLVFVDTTDGTAPRPDNLGTLVLDAEYLEALLVVQGHVVLRPNGVGRSLPALSPSPEGNTALGARIPVQLSGIHLSGLLWAAGTITVERTVRVYGAVMAGATVVAAESGALVEVWYNADFTQGLFRGLPVVYRVPGTWRVM
jgi:hypothetical protein